MPGFPPRRPRVSLLNNGVGRDFCWVYADERAAVGNLLHQRPVGGEFPLPPTLVRRLVRFHLVDNVRGTPNMWEASEVRAAVLNGRVTGANQLALSGHFDLRTASGRRGYAGTLEGRLTLSPRTGVWTTLRLLADGKAFGAGTFTPNQPPAPYRLLVGVFNTDRPEARIVPPEEVATFNRDTRYRTP